jgi:ribosomal protein S18 acetylase RimI-like enzyme
MTELKIFPYESKYHEDFVNISLEWLIKYNLYEESDIPILENPKDVILNNGGYILLAAYKNKIVGTVTLKKVDEVTFELLKLGVINAYQGKGIGAELMSYSIQLSKNIGAEKIILETNTKLETAIALYKKFNFKEIPLADMTYEMANFKMELSLNI